MAYTAMVARNKEMEITSLEVAEMVGKEHKNLLRDINRYCKQIKQANEELSNELKIKPSENEKIRAERKIELGDFFEESTYKDANSQSRPCYLVTKKGCEFIAHKLTGVKGTAFTARYINRFHDMEQALKKPQPAITEKDPFEHWEIRWKHETETWFSKNNWKLNIILERFSWTRKFLYHKILVELSDLHNLRAIEKAYYASYGYPPEYALDLLDFNRDLNDTATRYINYLLIEE
jgi:phage regulator Rha-like protein